MKTDGLKPVTLLCASYDNC